MVVVDIAISCFQCRHLIPAPNARPHARLPTVSGHGCTDGLTTERDFDSQATWVIAVVGLYCDMLSTGVCTTGAGIKWLYCTCRTWGQ